MDQGSPRPVIRRTQKIVILMAMICGSERIQSKIRKGKRHRDEDQEKSGPCFPGSSPRRAT